MSTDLLSGPDQPRIYRGPDFTWLCWDALVRLAPSEPPAGAYSSLDGGASIVPLAVLGDRPITNLRLRQGVDPGTLGLRGEILARRQPAGRHGRTLAFETIEAWRSHAGVLEVESSSSEMLFRCPAPPSGAAWRVNFQKRWLAIQHIAVAPPGNRAALDAAGNLLAGGLEGGALPALDTLEARYSARAARGVFATQGGLVEYRAVELGPLTYDMSFAVSPSCIEATVRRQASADCLAFHAPVLAIHLEESCSPIVDQSLLRLSEGPGAAVLRADPPLLWRAGDRAIDLSFDDEQNALSLQVIQAGRREGTLRLTFEM